MIELKFPKDDIRSKSSAEFPINSKRKWLFHGAKGLININKKFPNTIAVQFKDAPKGDYDLVSPEFVKSI